MLLCADFEQPPINTFQQLFGDTYVQYTCRVRPSVYLIYRCSYFDFDGGSLGMISYILGYSIVGVYLGLLGLSILHKD